MQSKDEFRQGIQLLIEHMTNEQKHVESLIVEGVVRDEVSRLEERFSRVSDDEAQRSKSTSRDGAPLAREELQVCSYETMKDEIAVHLPENMKVFYPQMNGDVMTFPKLDITKPLIMFVPGRVFDEQGGRIGRGGGAYDKWIAKVRAVNPNAKFIGVCFSCQIVSEVPMEEHDEQMDRVVHV